MPKRFILASSELASFKAWLHRAIGRGVMPLSHSDVEIIRDLRHAQKIIETDLTREEQIRLQRALAVRRARKKKPSGERVATELTPQARKILLAVATQRNLTTSDLIIDVLGDEYDAISLGK